MHTNPFTLPTAEYKRNINPVKQYCDQAAAFLNIMTGKDYDECMQFVRNGLRDGSFGAKDPIINYLEREENGDRVQKQSTLMRYLNESLADRQLIAPTLTTYCHPDEMESLLVNLVDDNIAIRGRAKKQEFAAKAAGNKFLESFKNGEQTNAKLSNNAVSGALVSASTPLFNKTGHSTLTSVCRSTSGYGNANNEKIVCGNRHYWSPQIVVNNIISITTNTNYDKLKAVIDKYNLKYPTVKDAIDCIEYSTLLYWESSKHMLQIQSLLENMTPIQRAAFVYTGDAYHLRVHNEEMMRTFITKLSSKITGECEDALNKIKTIYGDYVNLAHHICFDEMKGKGKNYEAMKGTPELSTLVLTSLNIQNTLFEYMDLIQAMWVTPNLPASMAHFPESVRRAAVTSDTDSTIFTAQEWVIWFKHGKVEFDNEAIAVGATMIFIASQSITHVLATMSANFGIVDKRLHQIAMKNEYFFDIFVPTSVGKHYFALMTVQEGNVFKEHDMEVKGVHLKNSNVPKKITKLAKEMMEKIMLTVRDNKKISILAYLKEVADLQREIMAGITRGETQYFRLSEIKSADSYKSPETSPYNYCEMWYQVFSSKYNSQPQVPYQAISISTNLDSPSVTQAWLDNMEDQEFAKRMKAWLVSKNKNKLPTVMIPVEAILLNGGIHKELVSAINIRHIVANLTKVFVMILETLGYFIKSDELVCDYY